MDYICLPNTVVYNFAKKLNKIEKNISSSEVNIQNHLENNVENIHKKCKNIENIGMTNDNPSEVKKYQNNIADLDKEKPENQEKVTGKLKGEDKLKRKKDKIRILYLRFSE